jgi:hypothetical protein
MKYPVILFILGFCTSCNWVKMKSKDTINGTGEVVAKAGSEFANGLAKGVEKTFQNQVVISDGLTRQGLKTGKIIINSGDSATDNILTAYLIFDNALDTDLTVKVFTENGQEYGRVTQHVKGNKGEARYVDLLFDKRTNIDGRGKITIE